MGNASSRTVVDRKRRDHESHGARAPQPHVHAPAGPDVRAVLGNRSTRMLIAQPKLTVGAAFDPLETEADRVAAEVVRSIAAAPSHDHGDHDHDHGGDDHGHECGDGCAVHRRRAVARSIRRAASLDGAPIGAGGGAVQAADEAAVNRARGGGAPLPADFRARVEPVMGADFSAVRVHTGPAAAQLNHSFGASAFTIGSDIFFRDGMPDVSTRDGAHLVSHELTHTIQQGGSASVARCSCGSTDHHIQRHSSFEHLMLGNVKPTDLATIGAWEDAIEQTKPKRSGLRKKRDKQEAQVEVDVGDEHLSISKQDILHVLMQEMVRLKRWQRDPPKESSAEQADKGPGHALRNVGKDPDYDVYTIELPQGILCTYGEMNTLADYFGSIDVMKSAAPKQVWQLLQSVREETWGFLTKTFNKVAKSLTDQERNAEGMDELQDTLMNEIIMPDLMDGGGFQDATAFRISGLGGQLELIFGVQGTGAEGETNKYTPSLGRNACHFVPESWHAWAQNHQAARELARESKRAAVRAGKARDEIATVGNDLRKQRALEQEVEEEKRISTDKANEALLNNGFGDHYLQDSYAAGHMINKTQIMQFYIEYIDKNNEWDYFKDENWRKVQNIAYGQTLAPGGQYDQSRVQGVDGAFGRDANKAMDPQSVENRSDGTWEQNFRELGLKVPPSLSAGPGSITRRILEWFQAQARAGKKAAKGKDVEAAIGGPARDVRMAVGDLVLDGVLLTDDDVSTRGKMMAEMRDKRSSSGGGLSTTDKGAGEQLERAKFLKRSFRLRDELKPKKGSTVDPGTTEASLQKGFEALTYNDYMEFITSAFLQKSTNALHDTFCKNGLTVYDRNDNEIGRVYGDDAMFSANSSMGVAHSGETSQMSRDAIVNIINTGQDGGKTEKSIVDRFPRKVRADIYDDKGKVVTAGVAMDIENWHNEKNRGGLKGEAFQWIFPSMSWSIKQKLAPGGAKTLGEFFTAKPPHNPF